MQPRGPAVQRRVAGALLLCTVLGLHLALLRNAPRETAGAASPATSRPATVLLMPARPAAVAVTAAAEADPAPGPSAMTVPAVSVQRGPAAADGPATAARAQPATPGNRPDPASPQASPPPAAADTAPAGAEPGPVFDPLPPTPGPPVPTYATRPPPTATLTYTLRRGPRSVPAQLLWAQDGTGYTLALATDDAPADVAGPLRGLGATSRGSFDAAGLAPERFIDRRRGRDRRATSFERNSGQVLQSAGPAPAPLQPGMQDRVSWMLQMAAILEANPALATAGARVQLWVAATRGPPQVWDFEVLPPGAHPDTDADLDDPSAAAAPPGLLHLQRRPARPHELQVDAWLDPARHHLPWRVLLSAPPGDWRSDLRRVGP